MAKERLKYIDLLRVLAMISVLVCHYTRSLEYAGVGFVNKILPDYVFNVYLGSFGVAIFFVLSGASLMYTYEGKFDIVKYIKKRFIGIFPMYWMAWIIAFLYLFYKNKVFDYTIPKAKILLTIFGMDGYANWYGKNFYILGEWFLGCLLLLYILFPILKIGVEKWPIITAVVIVLIYFVGSYFYSGTIPTANYFVFRIPEFIFGMYFVHYKWKVKWPVALAGVILLVCAAVFDLSMLPTLYKNSAVGILTVIVVAYISQFIKSELFFKVCSNIGKYAYAVFLTHHVVIQELCYHFNGCTFGKIENYIMFALCIFMVGVASKIMYNLNNTVTNAIHPVLFKKAGGN